MVNKGVIYLGDVSGNLASITTSGEVKIAGTISASASISGQPVQISGQTVIANVVTNISGQTVYLPNNGTNNVVSISGQTVVGSFTASVSGQAVLISGQTVTVANAVSTGVSGQTIYLVNNGVNNVVQISGQTVVASVVTNISGQVVIISGQFVQVLGPVAVQNDFSTEWGVFTVSGFNDVQVSGQSVRLPNDGVNNVVKISGQTVTVANNTTGVSGQTIYLVNDSVNNVTKISGQLVTVSGIVAVNSLPVISISGNMVSISGQPVTANVTTNISGQSIYTVSGRNDVQISGQIVQISGQVLGIAGVVEVGPGTGEVFDFVTLSGYNQIQVSGQSVRLPNDGVNNVVSISGQTVVASVVTNISGQVVRISGQVVSLGNELINVTPDGGAVFTVNYQAGANIVQISGQTVVANVVTNISGNHVSVSGIVAVNSLPVISVSGSTVSVSGIVSIGNAPTVLVSGGINVSGNTISISGIVRTAVPTAVRTRALLACTALSGGTQLLSGDVRKATVVNAGSAGTVMYIGSTTDPPFSGFGLYLSAGNGYTTETNNFNNIRAFAATSGGFISYIGEQF